MNRSIVLGCLLALGAAEALADSDRVTVCHDGQSLTVSEAALGAHLGHGDNRGACPQRNYRYYRDAEVYYDEDRGRYYYLQGDDWTSSDSPPGGFTLDPSGAVLVPLDEDRPYRRHGEVFTQYPPVQRRPYRYYPDEGVYFDPARSLFFLFAAGVWHSRDHGPDGFYPDRSRFEEIMLDSDRPYLRHDQMLERFGPSRGYEGSGDDKATLCHKGKTLTVGRAAVSAHLGHGDSRGACGDDSHRDRDDKDHKGDKGHGNDKDHKGDKDHDKGKEKGKDKGQGGGKDKDKGGGGKGGQDKGHGKDK